MGENALGNTQHRQPQGDGNGGPQSPEQEERPEAVAQDRRSGEGADLLGAGGHGLRLSLCRRLVTRHNPVHRCGALSFMGVRLFRWSATVP
jgi:hypothetical protein